MRRDHWFIFKNPVVRGGLAGIVGIVAAVALVANAGAAATTYCRDHSTGLQYPSDDGVDPFWYAQVSTTDWDNITPLFQTQGAKSNLSTEGHPAAWESNKQHVNTFVSSAEQPAGSNDPPNVHCHIGDCHVQVGWITGSFDACYGASPNNTGSAIDVYVEIFDDSGSTSYCLAQTFGGAPTNASYDARYYSTLSNGLHRYQVYYEVPGSGNIQNLAYGDFHDQQTYESAGTEILGDGTNLVPYCPVVGSYSLGQLNQVGAPAANTFAGNLQIYTTSGSWVNWSRANGIPTQQNIAPNSPYHMYAVANPGHGDYSYFETGGPSA